MSSRNRIPSAIEPYLQLPPETSLILLTGTLGCSANWLTARFVSSILSQKFYTPANSLDFEEPCVIIVSWMRDLAFWKNEVRRATVCTSLPNFSICEQPLTIPRASTSQRLVNAANLILSTISIRNLRSAPAIHWARLRRLLRKSSEGTRRHTKDGLRWFLTAQMRY